jgi:ornithine decarboxylase
MVMPTLVTDRFTALDYTDFTNNHVFMKSYNNGFFDYNQHGHHDQYDERKLDSAKQLIGEALRERVENIDHEFCEPGEEDTFFVADLGEVYRQHLRWKRNLPRIKPFYGKTCPGGASSGTFMLTICSRQVQPRPEALGAAVRPRHRL